MEPNYIPGAPPEEQPEPIKWAFSEIPLKEKKQILADHQAWLDDGAKSKPPHNLHRAILSEANLSESSFVQADLRGASLERSLLCGADLMWSDLRKAQLGEADLRGARFASSDLRGVSLYKADLRNSILVSADVRSCVLGGADLRGAALMGAQLDGVNVFGVRTDRKTKFLGVRGIDSTHGSAKFRDMAKHNEYLEEIRRTKRGNVLYWLWLGVADCGRSIWRWLLWCLFFAFGFAAVFNFGLGFESFKTPDPLPKDFWTMLYYSVVTFTTLGFGDVTPITRAAAWWVMAEVIVGYVMLGGLISIFATKLVARRG